MTRKFAKAALVLHLTLASAVAWAQVNAGEQKPEASLPFTMTTVTTFNLPWRMAFLPDGRMLVTEKVGPVWLVSQQGQKIHGRQYAPSLLAGSERHAGRLRLAHVTPPTRASISPMPSRATMAAAWRWPAPS